MSETSKLPPYPETSETTAHENWGWTRRQRFIAGVFAGAVIVFVIVGVVRMPADVNDPLMVSNGQRVTLPPRMDPNAATEAELETIPHMSGKVAANIVLFREARKVEANSGAVFHELGDLTHVPGVTKAVLAQIGPYLQFPGDTADTQPMP